MTLLANKVPFDAFISYHSGDAAWVECLKRALEAKNIHVWLDQEQIRPGDLFIEALEKGVESCGCVLMVVSSGAIRSRWVTEEYNRAMTLVNSDQRSLRIIPVLLEGAELPGFLKSRLFVDFRNPANFEQGIARLVFGINGCPQHSPIPPGVGNGLAVFQAPVLQTDDINEISYLERLMARDRRLILKLRLIQAAALIAGSALGICLVFSIDGLSRLIAILGSPLFTTLIATAATHQTLAACNVRLNGLVHLKDGLELCRVVTGPGCTRLESVFWDLVGSLEVIGTERKRGNNNS